MLFGARLQRGPPGSGKGTAISPASSKQRTRRMILKGMSSRVRFECAVFAGLECVFHPLHQGIELVPLGGGISNGQDVYDAPSAGEHHLFIINLISSITAEDEPRAATRLIGNLLIASSVGYHPTLKMLWRRIVLLVPGTNQKLGVDIIGNEIMEPGFAVALHRSEH